MKLKNIIENKLILVQKAYVRFPSIEKETKQFLADKNTNLSLIFKTSVLPSKQILGSNEYSILNKLNYKNFKKLEVIKNCSKQLNLPYISKVSNALKSQPKSLIIIKPIKGGFLTLLSNGIIAFINKSTVIKIFKQIYKINASIDAVSFLLKSTKQHKTMHNFFDLKFKSQIKTMSFKFKINKNLKKKLLSSKTSNFKITC